MATESNHTEDWRDSSDPKRAAVAWHAALDSQELPEAERRAFADWLRKSPTHVQEYLLVTGVRERLKSGQVEISAASSSNIEPFPATGAPPENSNRRRLRGPLWALAASILTGIGVWSIWPASPQRYVTAVGEQRSVVLPDGSIAELNTRSTMSVKFDGEARDIILNDGEALFKVARDSRRPFRVHSGAALIQAVGTQFNVRSDRGRAVVTVLEGRVEVNGADLAAGQRVAIAAEDGKRAAKEAVKVEQVNAGAAVAWQARRLVFDAAPLSEVVAEFNRYNTRRIQVEAAAAGERRITGVFNANDPEALVSFLGSEGVEVEKGTQGDFVIR